MNLRRGSPSTLRVHYSVTCLTWLRSDDRVLISVCACSCINTAAPSILRNMKDNIPAFYEVWMFLCILVFRASR